MRLWTLSSLLFGCQNIYYNSTLTTLILSYSTWYSIGMVIRMASEFTFSVFCSLCVCLSVYPPLNQKIMDRFQKLRCVQEHLDETFEYFM